MMKEGYDWKKTLWKGVRAALITAAAAAVAAFTQSLSADVFIELGLPAAVAVAIVEALRNLAKQVERGE